VVLRSQNAEGKTRERRDKNEMMRQMISRCIQNQVKFTYVLGDSWFGSSENMRLVQQKKKIFIFDMKSNRLAVLSEEDRNAGRWTALEDLTIPAHTPIKVWLKDLEFPVALVKQVFTNKDNSTGMRYLVSNDLTMTYDQFDTLFKKRWSVEEYHKSIKQNTALAKSPTRTIKTQSNHLFASILAYVKLEKYKFTTSLNHFAMKTKLYNAAIKAALKELHEIKTASLLLGLA
jgi:Transposase DDE domain